MAGDYRWFQKNYASKNADLAVVAATDTTTLITPKSANHQVYVQKIVVTVSTYAAKTVTFGDSAGTPVQIGIISIPAAAVALPSESSAMTYDFGPTGVPLTTGKNLIATFSATGWAGRIHVEAYERLVGPVAIATTN